MSFSATLPLYLPARIKLNDECPGVAVAVEAALAAGGREAVGGRRDAPSSQRVLIERLYFAGNDIWKSHGDRSFGINQGIPAGRP
jgi:hypothetical protein